MTNAQSFKGMLNNYRKNGDSCLSIKISVYANKKIGNLMYGFLTKKEVNHFQTSLNWTPTISIKTA